MTNRSVIRKRCAHGIRRAVLAAACATASLALPAEAQAAFTGPGVYVISIIDTNQVLDVEGNRVDLGQRLVRWGTNGGANQKFIIFASPRGGYVMRPLHSLLCLDLPGWATEVGVEPVQFHCTNADNQRFYFDPHERGYLIRTAHGGRILFAPREGGRVRLAERPGAVSVGMVFHFQPVLP